MEINALESAESIKNEGLYPGASTLRREVAFFLHLHPFGILALAVRRSGRGGVKINIGFLPASVIHNSLHVRGSFL